MVEKKDILDYATNMLVFVIVIVILVIVGAIAVENKKLRDFKNSLTETTTWTVKWYETDENKQAVTVGKDAILVTFMRIQERLVFTNEEDALFFMRHKKIVECKTDVFCEKETSCVKSERKIIE